MIDDTDGQEASSGVVRALDPTAPGDRDGSEPSPRENGHGRSTRLSRKEFLLEAIRRRPILSALQRGPASAAELADSIEMSRSTIHRATNTLEEHNVLEQSDDRFELTSLGRILAEKTAAFGDQAWGALVLEPFLNAVEMDGIPVEHLVDGRITRPTPRQPHASIQRIVELVEEASSLRMLSTVLSPIYVDVGYREMMDGMAIEAVFDEAAIEIMVSKYPEKAYETIRTGNFDVYSHHGLPFELFLFDETVGMAAHDENGIARSVVESDTPPALEWAEEIYERHRAEAEPLSLSDL